jgi:hypothetical protein
LANHNDRTDCRLLFPGFFPLVTFSVPEVSAFPLGQETLELIVVFYFLDFPLLPPLYLKCLRLLWYRKREKLEKIGQQPSGWTLAHRKLRHTVLKSVKKNIIPLSIHKMEKLALDLDPDPSKIKQEKKENPWFLLFCLLLYDFLSLKNDVNVPYLQKAKKSRKKIIFRRHLESH